MVILETLFGNFTSDGSKPKNGDFLGVTGSQVLGWRNLTQTVTTINTVETIKESNETVVCFNCSIGAAGIDEGMAKITKTGGAMVVDNEFHLVPKVINGGQEEQPPFPVKDDTDGDFTRFREIEIGQPTSTVAVFQPDPNIPPIPCDFSFTMKIQQQFNGNQTPLLDDDNRRFFMRIFMKFKDPAGVTADIRLVAFPYVQAGASPSDRVIQKAQFGTIFSINLNDGIRRWESAGGFIIIPPNSTWAETLALIIAGGGAGYIFKEVAFIGEGTVNYALDAEDSMDTDIRDIVLCDRKICPPMWKVTLPNSISSDFPIIICQTNEDPGTIKYQTSDPDFKCKGIHTFCPGNGCFYLMFTDRRFLTGVYNFKLKIKVLC